MHHAVLQEWDMGKRLPNRVGKENDFRLEFSRFGIKNWYSKGDWRTTGQIAENEKEVRRNTRSVICVAYSTCYQTFSILVMCFSSV